MYSKILPVTEGNYEQFDRGRYFILCKFHKSNILFARRDMNGSETWPRIWNISKFSNYLCAFFQIMTFENLRKIFSWKYSLGSFLNTLMSFINIFRLNFEKVKFYWLGDITRIGLPVVSGDEWKRESTRTDLVPKILWSHPYLKES